ncbi:MAG: hypothetical protein V1691_03960 [Chloroflexota bacterium]
MTGDANCCSDENCGCHLTVYSTDRKCPTCGGRLRLIGRTQQLEFRLACQSCDFHGPMLSREEIQEVL